MLPGVRTLLLNLFAETLVDKKLCIDLYKATKSNSMFGVMKQKDFDPRFQEIIRVAVAKSNRRRSTFGVQCLEVSSCIGATREIG